MKTLYSFIFLFLFTFSNAFCQQEGVVITLPTTHFQVDKAAKMVVCNDDLSKYADLSEDAAVTVVLGAESFTLEDKVNKFEAGSYYTIKKGEETYKLYFTTLPVLSVSSSKKIADEPKVAATFTFSAPSGETYSSDIGIEIRGGSSQSFPKKSYDIELWKDSNGDETDSESFLGMRKDDDWLLIAMYNEPLKITNATSQSLWQKMHTLHYAADEPEAKSAIDTRYVELFLNNEYVGIYALTEQLDSKQLQLKDYKDNASRGELYKGFYWGDANFFLGLNKYNNNNKTWSGYEHRFPEEEINWANLFDFTSFVLNSTDEDFNEGLADQFDLENAMDYFILVNIANATDNTGKNLYVAKYEDDSPYFYVPWDMDGTWGFKWDGTRNSATDGLVYNFFLDRLLRSNPDNFREKLKSRWLELRSDQLSTANLYKLFEDNYNVLEQSGAYARDNAKWTQYPSTAEDLQYLKDWIEGRVTYLDNYFTSVTEKEFAAYQDKTSPLANFNVHSNSAPVAVSFRPTLTLSEPSRLLNDQPISAEEVSGLLEFRLNSKSGALVPFSATITDNVITIIPANKLEGNTTYYVSLKANVIEDYVNNASSKVQSTVFTTAPVQDFAAGDIVLTAYRMNASDAEDEFSFVALVDITPGVMITFTDSKYTNNTQPQCEGGITWTAPAEGVAAGTTIKIQPDALSASVGTITGEGFGLGSGGDQIIVYTGTAAEPAYITALSSNAWVSTNTKCGGGSSMLPVGLEDSKSSINLSTTPGNTSGNTVNAYYNGPQSGSPEQLRQAILDPANWLGLGEDTPAQAWPNWEFTFIPLSIVEKEAKNNSFIVYPNPATGNTVFFTRKTDIVVYNTLGQVINTSFNVDSLDITNFNQGLYLIKTKEGITRSLIIRKN